jgi:hypothetical protein
MRGARNCNASEAAKLAMKQRCRDSEAGGGGRSSRRTRRVTIPSAGKLTKYMSKFAIFAQFVFIGTVLLPPPAVAKCENGAPPSYDDIRAIGFQRWGCASRTATSLRCSRYAIFVSNWDWGQHEVAEYSQFTIRGQIGRYALSVDALALISILRRYNFFELSPPNVLETDVIYSVLTVKRCAIVTRIAMPAEIFPSYMKMGASYYATMDWS